MQLKKKNLNLTVHRKFIQPAVKIGKTRQKNKQKVETFFDIFHKHPNHHSKAKAFMLKGVT